LHLAACNRPQFELQKRSDVLARQPRFTEAPCLTTRALNYLPRAVSELNFHILILFAVEILFILLQHFVVGLRTAGITEDLHSGSIQTALFRSQDHCQQFAGSTTVRLANPLPLEFQCSRSALTVNETVVSTSPL